MSRRRACLSLFPLTVERCILAACPVNLGTGVVAGAVNGCQQGQSIAHDTSCTLACDPLFTPSGSPVVSCSRGVASSNFTCTRIQCSDPTTVPGYSLAQGANPGPYFVGDNIALTCTAGYEGTPVPASGQCGSDGVWVSATTPSNGLENPSGCQRELLASPCCCSALTHVVNSHCLRGSQPEPSPGNH